MQKILMLLLLVTNCGFIYSQEIKQDSIRHQEEELDEVIIQSTKTSRTIRNTPTRIESIDGEELSEKTNMKLANVSMLLRESTGLQVQQTSATSGSASIRVQGLDGRYTQLLKDGYPNFGNFASGLSILEIPPLDLKQVEIIKGPASTLFGGGAIAGVINFISKTPGDEPEHNFMINQTSIGQTNIGGFSSERTGKWGYTVLGLVNFQKSYDVDKDDFSDIPKSNNFTINPKLFYYPNSKTSFMIGNSFTKGDLTGGDMHVIDGNSDANHTYFEKNETIRNTTSFEFERKSGKSNSFSFKQSLSFFDRKIFIPNYQFSGLNTNAFTDVSYVWNSTNQTIIGGINLTYDNFRQAAVSLLDAKSFTTGLYIQHTWDISEKVKLENGLRIDNVNYSTINFSKNQSFVLPKVAVLFVLNSKWSSRIGVGLGYKIPTTFTEKTEKNQYQNVLSLDEVKAELSTGGTADINFKSKITTDLVFSLNQMLFITQINDPLVLESDGNNFYFVNAHQPTISKGFETNAKFIFKHDFKLFTGYTFTDTKAKYQLGNQYLALVPKNKLNLALIYEKENNFKFGFEAYFTDKQYLSNGSQTTSYWELGFMVEKMMWKHFAFFVNFENFTDTRQSSYKRVINGPNNNPTFDEIWTNTEGFVFNGGVKIKL